MKVVDIRLTELEEAAWNAHGMDKGMLARLRESVRRFGLVENLVVRPMGKARYEVLSGNQRLRVLREARVETVPCVVVDLDDAHARLLAQALNHVQGEDDLGLRAELLREVLERVPESDVLALLPETADSLQSLASLGQQDIAEHLQAWQQAQAARLKHMQFQFTPMQMDVVEEALSTVMPVAKDAAGENPNVRGTALYLLCKSHLERAGKVGK